MTPRQQLMRELYKTYLELFLGSMPGVLGRPLRYARFVDVICYIVAGELDREQEVLERYAVYKDYCLKHAQPVDLVHFVAKSIVQNRQRITDYLLRHDDQGIQLLPLSMN